MSDLIVREMTKKEAEAEVAAFTSDWYSARGRLLNMFEGKAHKALGYATFEEFAQERLGINVSDSTIKKHLAAARVERNIGESQPKSVTRYTLPIRAALELNRLPDDQQAEAYAEVKMLAGYGTLLPKQIERSLKDIVTRKLNQPSRATSTPAPPTPAPIIIENVEPIKPRVPIKPIVPPTYDRGPEFDDEPTETSVEAPPVIAETPIPPIEPTVTREVAAPIREAVTPPSNTVSRFQYDALLSIAKAFAGAVDRADKDAAIEARVDFKNFLKEWGP